MNSNRKKRLSAFAITAAMVMSSTMPMFTEVFNTSVHIAASEVWSYPTVAPNPATAFAGGEGTQGSPYQIATAQQLANMAYLINNDSSYKELCYELTENIVLNEGDVNAESINAAKWTPIGNVGYFKGEFNGKGHTVIGMYINSTNNYNGLFGDMRGVVKNLSIVNSYISSAGEYAGLLAGKVGGTNNLNKASITNCCVSGSVTSSNDRSGLFTGNFQYGTISNCYAKGTLTNTNEEPNNMYNGVFGFYGYSDAQINNCFMPASASYAMVSAYGDSDSVTSLSNCGTFDESGNITAGVKYKSISNSSIDDITQTLSTTGNLLTQLNAYVTAHPNEGLKAWSAGDDGYPTLNDPVPSISGISVSLNDSFSVNVTADDEQFEEGGTFADYTVLLEVEGGDDVTEYSEDAQTGDYKFEDVTAFCAKNLGDTFKVRLKAVKESQTVYSAWKEYNIREYMMSLIKGEYSDKTKKLAVDILNYGAAAQTYFDYETDKLVNADLIPDQQALATVISPDDILSALGTSTSAYQNPDDYYGTSLLLKDKVQLRHYITADTAPEGWEGPKTFDEEKCCYNTVTGITPLQFADDMTSVNDANTYKYSVNRYIYDVLNSSEDENLKALVAEVYKYGVSAEDYASKTYTVNSISDSDLDNDSKMDEIKAAITLSSITYNKAVEIVNKWRSKNSCESDAYFLYNFDDSLEDDTNTVHLDWSGLSQYDNIWEQITGHIYMMKQNSTCGAYYITES